MSGPPKKPKFELSNGRLIIYDFLGKEHTSIPLPKFPAIAWRGLFKRWRDVVGGTTEAPDAFAWASFAAAFSVLIGRDAGLPWGTGTVYPIINCCLLGPTGKGRKSTPMDDILEAVVERLRDGPSITIGGTKYDLWNWDPDMGEPCPLEVVVGSGSGEGFLEALADQKYAGGKGIEPLVQRGRRGFFVVNELGALMAKIARQQAGNMEDFIIACYDARRRMSHRTRRGRNGHDNGYSGPLEATDATGVFLAASTISWLAETLTSTHIHNGFINRWLFFAAERQGPTPIRGAIAGTKKSGFVRRLCEALTLIRGRQFRFTSQATKLYEKKYRKDFYQEQLDDFASATARSDQTALRLALLCAAGDVLDTHIGNKIPVRPEHVETGWAVVEYSNKIVRILLDNLAGLSNKETEDRIVRAAQRVCSMNGGAFKPWQVRRRVRGTRGMSAEDFIKGWNALIYAGDIVERPDGVCVFRED